MNFDFIYIYIASPFFLNLMANAHDRREKIKILASLLINKNKNKERFKKILKSLKASSSSQVLCLIKHLIKF